MSVYFVYILYSAGSDIYYVGSTDDFSRRFSEHNSDLNNKFSGKHRPWKLKLVLSCGHARKDAVSVERLIKKQKSRVFIERIIKGEKLTGVLEHVVRVPHERD